MMMPANFSAVAENEMTYVVGGSLVDVLAPAMTTANWQNVVTNLITITGNTWLNDANGGKAVYNNIFSGKYVPFSQTAGAWEAVGSAYESGKTAMNGDWAFGLGLVNAGLKVAQGLAAIYTLGTARVSLEVKKFN